MLVISCRDYTPKQMEDHWDTFLCVQNGYSKHLNFEWVSPIDLIEITVTNSERDNTRIVMRRTSATEELELVHHLYDVQLQTLNFFLSRDLGISLESLKTHPVYTLSITPTTVQHSWI